MLYLPVDIMTIVLKVAETVRKTWKQTYHRPLCKRFYAYPRYQFILLSVYILASFFPHYAHAILALSGAFDAESTAVFT